MSYIERMFMIMWDLMLEEPFLNHWSKSLCSVTGILFIVSGTDNYTSLTVSGHSYKLLDRP